MCRVLCSFCHAMCVVLSVLSCDVWRVGLSILSRDVCCVLFVLSRDVLSVMSCDVLSVRSCDVWRVVLSVLGDVFSVLSRDVWCFMLSVLT